MTDEPAYPDLGPDAAKARVLELITLRRAIPLKGDSKAYLKRLSEVIAEAQADPAQLALLLDAFTLIAHKAIEGWARGMDADVPDLMKGLEDAIKEARSGGNADTDAQ